VVTNKNGTPHEEDDFVGFFKLIQNYSVWSKVPRLESVQELINKLPPLGIGFVEQHSLMFKLEEIPEFIKEFFE